MLSSEGADDEENGAAQRDAKCCGCVRGVPSDDDFSSSGSRVSPAIPQSWQNRGAR